MSNDVTRHGSLMIRIKEWVADIAYYDTIAYQFSVTNGKVLSVQWKRQSLFLAYKFKSQVTKYDKRRQIAKKTVQIGLASDAKL